MPLTYELKYWQEKIEQYAKEYGLDFFEVYFELLSPREINELAALEGFPQRYPHWRFGMMYDQMTKGYTYGLQRIYEMVINNDPAYAYLMATNPLVVNKMVIAHVYAHCDFFKNNRYFMRTNRKMIDEMANHAAKVRRYIDRYGEDTVEEFLDRALSIDNLIDINLLLIDREDKLKQLAQPYTENELEQMKRKEPQKLEVPQYMDKYINPPEALKEEREEAERKAEQLKRRFPRKPLRDVIWFLIQHAPLDNWQKDILSIVREEAYYFAPQAMTKILNEGWAAFWHSKILTEKALDDSEIIDFADKNAEILRPSRTSINPYRLGRALLEDIKERWDKGRYGKEWEECDDMVKKANWDTKEMRGMEKLFEVRIIHNDVTFIDEFLTKDFVERQLMYTYRFDRARARYVIDSRKFQEIKNKLLSQLTNIGHPVVETVDGNFENRGEMLLIHAHYGVDLHMPYAKATLENLYHLWTRPVNLITKFEDQGVILRFDGKEHSIKQTEYDSWREKYY